MSHSLNRDEELGTNPEFRGRFHFSPPRGWMNDPNGFSCFGGTYHLFIRTILLAAYGGLYIGATPHLPTSFRGRTCH